VRALARTIFGKVQKLMEVISYMLFEDIENDMVSKNPIAESDFKWIFAS